MEPEVISLGCRLNAAEGAAMKRLAGAAGLGPAVIVNSCAVTAEAVRQTRQAVRRARRERPEARVIVTGCAAQIDGAAFAAMPEVDAVIGNADKLRAAEWSAIAAGAAGLRVSDIFAVREAAPELVEAFGERARAFLEVQTGCDHRCTFCIIPFGRGASRSVPAEAALAAARRLVEAGHRELVLTGVDITSWGQDLEGAPRLGRLVARLLDEVPGLERLRLSSIDGAEADAELIDRAGGDPRFAPHLHLSLQSGDDMILKRMKRRHTRADAIRLCETLRARRPDIAFGADLIAGFPTETDEMFANSLRLVDEAGLQYVHVFPFSPRAGTPAARMPQLPRETVRQRAEALRLKARETLTRFLDSLVGRVEDAILEAGQRARLANFAAVRLTAPAGPAGGLATIAIIGREGGELLGAPTPASAG